VLLAVAIVLFPRLTYPWNPEAARTVAWEIVQEEVQRMRDLGEPMTLDEILPPPPESENCAAALLALDRWRRVYHESELPKAWLAIEPDVTDEHRAELRAYARRSKEFLDRLERALVAPRIRFDDENVEECNAAFSLISHARDLLAIAGAHLDDDGVLRAARLQLALGAKWEPVGEYAPLVAMTLRRAGCLSLRNRLRNRLPDPRDVLEELRPLLRADMLERFADAVRMNRALHVRSIAAWLGRADARRPSLLFSEFPGPRGMPAPADTFRRAVRGYFDVSREFATLPRDSHVVHLDRVYKLMSRAEQLPPLFRTSGDKKDRRKAEEPDTFLIGDWLLADDQAAPDALLRLAHLSLELLVHREQTGNWPASLDVLRERVAGSVLIDPFTDEPFLYRRVPGGVEIRSADPGADGEWDTLSEREPEILVWALPD
jgi:hypothetical protein